MQNATGTGVSAFPSASPTVDTRGVTDEVEGDSMLRWICTLEGPADTPWERRRVRCSLCFCPVVVGAAYPDRPPQVRVLPPRPVHPNIDPVSGAVCMDLLTSEWSAGVGVLGLLLSFRSLLASPSQGDAISMPANMLAARLLLHEPDEYRRVNRAIAEGMPHCT